MSSENASHYVGLAHLPNIMERKAAKRGIEFSLMVVGQSGLGKTTLINSLFNLDGDRQNAKTKSSSKDTVTIETNFMDIEERGVRLKLNLVTTPGYGESLDCSNDYKPIIDYVDEQLEKYFNDESGFNRRQIRDTRVHCCFYMINPYSRGLKPIDIQFFKLLQNKINIVPIIAKADFLTENEKVALKKRINTELREHKIHLYAIPDCDPGEDQAAQDAVDELKKSTPFAVCASNDFVNVKGARVRGREYPWGTVAIENPDHSDFLKLHSMFMYHICDMREVTHNVHYENFRAQRLTSVNNPRFQDSLRDNISMASGTEYGDSERERLLIEKDAELRKMREEFEKLKEEMSRRQTTANGNNESCVSDDQIVNTNTNGGGH